MEIRPCPTLTAAYINSISQTFTQRSRVERLSCLYKVNLYLSSPSNQVLSKEDVQISCLWWLSIQFAAEMRCRRDSSVLTQLEVEELTPRLSCSLSLLVSHGVLSLLGNTKVYCSVLVSRLSLSLSLHPPTPPLILYHSQYTTLCYVSEALSALHIVLPHPLSCSPLLPSSLPRPSNEDLYLNCMYSSFRTRLSRFNITMVNKIAILNGI